MSVNLDLNVAAKDLWRFFERKGIDAEKLEPGTLRDLWQALYAARSFIDYTRARGKLDSSMEQEVKEFEKLYSALVKQTERSPIIGS